MFKYYFAAGEGGGDILEKHILIIYTTLPEN